MLKNLLIKLAELMYRPQVLKPVPGWYVGMLENENKLGFYRKKLQKIWSALVNDGDCGDITVRVKWWRHIELAIYPKTASGRCVYIEGLYEPNEFYFLDKFIKPGMVFIDIGANNGWFGIFASKKVGSEGMVYMIEPSQREVAKINKNIELNYSTNVKVFQCGLSDKDGLMDLLIAEDKYDGHNTFGDFIYKTNLKTIEKVRVDTLDLIDGRENFKKINLIKIDAEGSEFLILKGAINVIKQFRPVMLIEISELSLRNQGCDSVSIFSFLNDLMYRFYAFNKNSGILEPFSISNEPGVNLNSSFNLIAAPAEKEIIS